jgi:hypothetical protein
LGELDVQTRGPALDLPPVETDWIDLPPAVPAPLPETPERPAPAVRPRLRALAAAPPIVFVDPRSWTLTAVRSVRARGAQPVVLSGSRFEPALYAHGALGHRLPSMRERPESWTARLLELAARLEPRAVLFACSLPALELLRRARRLLEPHFTLANLTSFESPVVSMTPETALRQALLRGDAALEVQLVRDRRGESLASCILAWAPGAPPDVLVSCVDGHEVETRSMDLLEARRTVGYARLVWAPDRFGRLGLHALSTIPGAGFQLAASEGLDLAAVAYAVAAGLPCAPQTTRPRLVRRLPLLDPEGCSEDAPIVALPQSFSHRDPLPWVAGILRGLLRP